MESALSDILCVRVIYFGFVICLSVCIHGYMVSCMLSEPYFSNFRIASACSGVKLSSVAMQVNACIIMTASTEDARVCELYI